MKQFFISVITLITAVLSCHGQIFYKVEGPGLEKPSYIFGTHHFAPESILDTLPQVGEALKDVKCVVGELEMTDNPMALAADMQPHMMAPADSTLSRLIPAEKYASLDSVFSSLTGGMLSLSMLEPMKPAATSMTLSGIIASREMPQNGQLDTYFQQFARQNSMNVAGLETADFQAHVLFDIIPLDRQAQSLIEILENPDEIMKGVRDLTTAYLTRDADAIWRIAQEAESDSEGEFFEVLLNRRNSAWLEKLPGMMESDPLFIAVGALHLYGDGGLVEGLRKLGYTVTPIL